MKNIMIYCMLLCGIIALNACEKDEGKLPNISFKTGSGYIHQDDSIAVGAPILIGINASKSEDKDGLKKFNISKSVDGASSISVYSQDLSGGDEDKYNHDFAGTFDANSGQKIKYTFTVTNRDGLSNTVSLTLIGK